MYNIPYFVSILLYHQEWRFKLIAEQSKAAVCPSIVWHLIGSKKIQQELSRPGVLEKYIDDPEVIAAVRSTFAGMYSLDLVRFPYSRITLMLYYEHSEDFPVPDSP